jgi:hypothetical protein
MFPFKKARSNKVFVDNTPTEDVKNNSDAVVPLSPTLTSAFTCPISLEIMVDPVITKQGYSFERTAILNWLRTNKTCPLTREPLEQKDLVPNLALKRDIEERRKNGQLPALAIPVVVPPAPKPGLWEQVGPSQTSAFANVRTITISWSSPRVDRNLEEQRLREQQRLDEHRLREQQRLDEHRLRENLAVSRLERDQRMIIITEMLRQRRGTYNQDPLDPVDIPETPDLSFLEEPDKNMISAAYSTISRLNKWDYMRRYSPNGELGYTWDESLELHEILEAVSSDYNDNHSGSSMGYTMRNIQYIAKNGFENFKRYYSTGQN